MISIPAEASAISAEWLSEVLQSPVDAVRLVDENSGTTGRAVLELEHAGGADLPERVFVKLPPTDVLQRQFVVSSGMGRREVLFYQHLSREVPMRVPHCYHAACDEVGEQYIMLLEHLDDSQCTFKNASTRYGTEYLQQVLAAFASLHASYWQTSRFQSDLAWLQPPLQHDIALPLIERALQLHGSSMPDIFTRMGELYLNQTDAIHRLWREGVPTLIHGDVHDANLFMDGDTPGFLDWALAARGPGLRDVGYFLAGALTPDDQRAWGSDLLAYYREQLLARGVAAPTAESLWQQYQWHAAYVWVGATVTLAMGEDWQPVSYVLPALERINATLEIIGSEQALRAAL